MLTAALDARHAGVGILYIADPGAKKPSWEKPFFVLARFLLNILRGGMAWTDKPLPHDRATPDRVHEKHHNKEGYS